MEVNSVNMNRTNRQAFGRQSVAEGYNNKTEFSKATGMNYPSKDLQEAIQKSKPKTEGFFKKLFKLFK